MMFGKLYRVGSWLVGRLYPGSSSASWARG